MSLAKERSYKLGICSTNVVCQSCAASVQPASQWTLLYLLAHHSAEDSQPSLHLLPWNISTVRFWVLACFNDLYSRKTWVITVVVAVIRPHRIAHVTYADVAYCYRPSSVVCQSVCHTSEHWHSAMSCAKWLNLSICRLGCELRWAEGSTGSIVFGRWRQCALMERHIGATWRIRLNHPSAAMRLYVKLLWPLVSNRQTISFVPPLVLELLVINGTGFYGPDALSVTQPTVSKHWRKLKALTGTFSSSTTELRRELAMVSSIMLALGCSTSNNASTATYNRAHDYC